MNNKKDMILPKSCERLDDNQMIETEGGWYINKTISGCEVFLTHEEVSDLSLVFDTIHENYPLIPLACCQKLASLGLSAADKGRGVKVQCKLLGVPAWETYKGLTAAEAKLAKKNKVGFEFTW